jgi:hypothetical protein
MDGSTQMLEVITVIPDLDDLAAGTEPEDVQPREFGVPSGRRNSSPHPAVRARGSPPHGDEIALREKKVDPPLQVWKCPSERLRDLCLSRSARRRPRGPEIMTT